MTVVIHSWYSSKLILDIMLIFLAKIKWPVVKAFKREGKGDIGRARSTRGAQGRREGNRLPLLPSPSHAVLCPNSLYLLQRLKYNTKVSFRCMVRKKSE